MPLTVTEKIFKRALREEEIKKMKDRECSNNEKGRTMIPYASPEWVAEVGRIIRPTR